MPSLRWVTNEKEDKANFKIFPKSGLPEALIGTRRLGANESGDMHRPTRFYGSEGQQAIWVQGKVSTINVKIIHTQLKK